MISSARMLCGTARESNTVSAFGQIYDSGDSFATTGDESAANQQVPHPFQNHTKVGAKRDFAASAPWERDGGRPAGPPTPAAGGGSSDS
jgi:hypothetical protein